MVILGINGGFRQGYQDVSACLVIDGRVVAAIEEERLNRVKFSPGRLPFLSVTAVLRIAGLTIQDVDIVAFHGSTWGTEIDGRVADYFLFHFGYAPPLRRYHHHMCHGASSFYASGFEEALVLTMDNSGDGVSTQVLAAREGRLQLIEEFKRPDSLGFFYSLITQFCGFVKDADEYKLMGLASYGDRTKFDLSWLIDFSDGALRLNTDYTVTVPQGAPSLHRDEMNFNAQFVSRIGFRPRIPGSPVDAIYKDLAASAQRHLEDTVLKILSHYISQTGLRKVCLSGGVAMNCVLNQRILDSGLVEDLFIQPASGDAGISLGAAWLATVSEGIRPIQPENTYLGNSFTNDEIRRVLNNCNIRYSEPGDTADAAAALISRDRVIGWYQGRMEFGPRALGNRSILANPLNEKMKETINEKIKYREGFRPFCPSVTEETASLYFTGQHPVSPYMTVTYDVRPDMRETIPAVTHVDGTARIQTVSAVQNKPYHSLLTALMKMTGHGIVLNTSMNLNHEPIVCTPYNALSTFYGSGMDALIIGDFLIEK